MDNQLASRINEFDAKCMDVLDLIPDGRGR